MKRIFLITLLVVFSFTFSSCGYTTRSSLSPDLKTIHIKPFINNVDYVSSGETGLYVPLLEVKVRSAVISRYQFDGNLKISDNDGSDLVLTGALESYERDVLREDDNDDVEEYRIRIVVSLSMYNSNLGEVIWKEPGFAGETTYFLQGASAVSEEVALEDALTDLAQRIVDRTIENW